MDFQVYNDKKHRDFLNGDVDHPFMQEETHENQLMDLLMGPDHDQQQNPQQGNMVEKPFMLHAVTDELQSVSTYRPDITRMSVAYKDVAFLYADSEKKRIQLVREAQKRFALQEQLGRKIVMREQNPVQARDVTLKKAIGYTDAELVKHYGEQVDEAADYVKARVNLMKNYYYTMVPVDEMRKLPRAVLMQKLRAEYDRDERHRNKMLIRFYQDLIRLKICEEKEASKDKKVSTAREADKTKDNKSAYKKNSAMLDAARFLTAEQKTARRDAMAKVLTPERTYWTDLSRTDRLRDDKNSYTAAQAEGARQILAFLYRNCNDDASNPMEAFVYKLTQAKPIQQLLFFYTIENGLQTQPTPECFLEARNYTPNVEVFKSKVKSGFIAKSIEWKKIGEAAHFALDDDTTALLDEYTASERQVKSAEDSLENLAHNGNQNDIAHLRDEEMSRFTRLMSLGDMIMTMYRSAGLTADMPTDMIQNETLRAKVEQTADKFLAEMNALSATQRKITQINNEQNGAQEPEQRQGDVVKKEGMAVKNRDAKGQKEGLANKEDKTTVMGKIKDVSTDVGYVMHVDKVLKVIGMDWSQAIVRDNFYSYSTGGVNAGLSLIGFIASVLGTAKMIAGGAKTLSTADITAKSFGLAGGILGSGSGIVKSIVGIVNQYSSLGELPKGTTWFGNTTLMTAKDSFYTINGGINFVTGGVQILAGIAQIAGGAIEYRRQKSNLQNVKDAKNESQTDEVADQLKQQIQSLELQKRLPENASPARQNVLQQRIEDKKRQIEAREKHREKLAILLNHQKKMATIQKNSAIMQMVTGSVTVIGGVLSMTGILAPVGGVLGIVGSLTNIGFGILYARKKKNQAKKDAVDEGIHLNKAVARAKELYPELRNLDKKDEIALRDQIRMESLAELHYATWQDCYQGFAKDNAVMLYKGVFGENGQAPNPELQDYKIHLDAMLALGYNKEDIKPATKPGEKSYPTLEDIYSRLMA